jgi:tRNA(Ile)-lysidine synthase TilS/MesJ
MQYNNQRLSIFYIKRKKINIIRPLVILNRFQVLKTCIFLHLPLYIDSTNQLTSFRRNRLRHQIYPLFKIFFNPKIDIALARFISIFNSENIYFQNHLKNIKKFIKIKNLSFKKIQALNWAIFLPRALQRKIYQNLLTSLFKSLTFNEIEFLLRVNIFFFK